MLCFVLVLLASPFKSKSRPEARNAVLRQLIVLRRRLQERGTQRKIRVDHVWKIAGRWVALSLKKEAKNHAQTSMKCEQRGDWRALSAGAWSAITQA